MSINIATRGMFNSCCGGGTVIPVGGAIPFRQEKEEKKIKITITKVELTNIHNKNIYIKLLDT